MEATGILSTVITGDVAVEIGPPPSYVYDVVVD